MVQNTLNVFDKLPENILIDTIYYRISDPLTNSKNYSGKYDIQNTNNNNLLERTYESVRTAITGITVNDTNISNILIKITGSNIHKELDGDTNFPYDRIDTETIEIINLETNDFVIAMCIYVDGILENTNSITKEKFLTFSVISSSGIYKNAKKIVIEYLKDVLDDDGKDIRPRICNIYT
jgi:hypothetical protein